MWPYAKAYWSLWDTDLGPTSAINTHTNLARAAFIRLGTIGIMLEAMGNGADTKMGLHGADCALVTYRGTRANPDPQKNWHWI